MNETQLVVKTEDKKQIVFQEFSKLFWVFLIGSILGFIYETILVFFQKGHFESRRGLLYGSFIPVYGLGGMAYYLVFRFLKQKDNWQVFFISMLLRRYHRIFGILYARNDFWNDFMGLFLSTF